MKKNGVKLSSAQKEFIDDIVPNEPIDSGNSENRVINGVKSVLKSTNVQSGQRTLLYSILNKLLVVLNGEESSIDIFNSAKVGTSSDAKNFTILEKKISDGNYNSLWEFQDDFDDIMRTLTSRSSDAVVAGKALNLWKLGTRLINSQSDKIIAASLRFTEADQANEERERAEQETKKGNTFRQQKMTYTKRSADDSTYYFTDSKIVDSTFESSALGERVNILPTYSIANDAPLIQRFTNQTAGKLKEESKQSMVEVLEGDIFASFSPVYDSSNATTSLSESALLMNLNRAAEDNGEHRKRKRRREDPLDESFEQFVFGLEKQLSCCVAEPSIREKLLDQAREMHSNGSKVSEILDRILAPGEKNDGFLSDYRTVDPIPLTEEEIISDNQFILSKLCSMQFRRLLENVPEPGILEQGLVNGRIKAERAESNLLHLLSQNSPREALSAFNFAKQMSNHVQYKQVDLQYKGALTSDKKYAHLAASGSDQINPNAGTSLPEITKTNGITDVMKQAPGVAISQPQFFWPFSLPQPSTNNIPSVNSSQPSPMMFSQLTGRSLNIGPSSATATASPNFGQRFPPSSIIPSSQNRPQMFLSNAK
ncbi:hypothetical protein HK098_003795 [Nowakowskiella sp. JEL0407]|nr:hypothetical protein HK098_003795 [Nowakowskiella sp. JEL0407]